MLKDFLKSLYITMSEFKYQRIIFLSNDFVGSKTFNKNIQMSFTPTKMNVKFIHYTNDQTETKTRILYMDRIGIIGTFADSSIANISNLSYNLGVVGWTDGQYTFKVLESDSGNIDTGNLAGRIVICLEFLG